MGVVPLVILLGAFVLAGYFIGQSDRRSFMGDVLFIAALALIIPAIIVVWMGEYRYEGMMFILLNFLQFTLFGVFGIMAGKVRKYYKNIDVE